MPLLVALVLLTSWVVAPVGLLAKEEKKRHRDQGSTGAGPGSDQAKDRKDKRDDEKDSAEEPVELTLVMLQRLLGSKKSEDVKKAFAGLRRRRDADARRLLTDFAKSKRRPKLRAGALLALGWPGNRKSVEFLSGKYGVLSSSNEVAAAACRTLGNVGDPAAIEILLTAVRRPAPEVAAGAVEGLATLAPKDTRVHEVLTMFEEHEDAALRASVARALAELDDAKSLARLRAYAATDASPAVRAAACTSLGDRGDITAIGDLERLRTEDEDKSVRAAAFAALTKIADADE